MLDRGARYAGPNIQYYVKTIRITYLIIEDSSVKTVSQLENCNINLHIPLVCKRVLIIFLKEKQFSHHLKENLTVALFQIISLSPKPLVFGLISSRRREEGLFDLY